MLDCGFSQLLPLQTMVHDHVYCNSPAPEQVVTNVADVYYSDHDAVLCSIPL